MQNQSKDKRSSIFTVRNAENAMITFCIFAIALLVAVFLHQFVLMESSVVDAFYTVAYNISKIMSAATMLTISEEGIDIMFQRIRDTLKKEEQLIAKAKDEVYKEIEDWDQRRKQAEARGEPFTEPPPAPRKKPSKK